MDNPRTAIYRRSQAVVARVIAGETLLVPVRGGVGDLASIYSFNTVGTTIWDALAEAKPFGQLVDRLVHEYAVSREQAEEDTRAFLRELEDAGLIEIAIDSAPIQS